MRPDPACVSNLLTGIGVKAMLTIMSLLLKPKTAQRMPSDELSSLARRAAEALAARSSRRAFDEIAACLSRLAGTEWRHEYEPVVHAESPAQEPPSRLRST